MCLRTRVRQDTYETTTWFIKRVQRCTFLCLESGRFGSVWGARSLGRRGLGVAAVLIEAHAEWSGAARRFGREGHACRVDTGATGTGGRGRLARAHSALPATRRTDRTSRPVCVEYVTSTVLPLRLTLQTLYALRLLKASWIILMIISIRSMTNAISSRESNVIAVFAYSLSDLSVRTADRLLSSLSI